METVGFVGVGKIGLPISRKPDQERLPRARLSPQLARRVREGSAAFPRARPPRSAQQADIVFSCLPSSEALDEVVQGPNGLLKSARPGQIIVELGSHPVPDKQRHVAPLAAKGAAFLDGEVSGTPGMVAARKARDLSRRRQGGLREGRALGRRLCRLRASISGRSAPRAG